ncbi:MAG: hypothetical protein A3A61_00865 [Candidatus Woykebacteria bacterium RIFCSPLOWO2_01_FULL_43_14]|uniref:Addiction module toxin RelE n=2 Tax=Candidatus Woykeibacteriota TaxID=1817899 RepID=A0A1G1WXP0_9BACT|nr:MAG: hypothetical protein A3J50_01340 [Candidatus Woykebacteria bacterium RIFCSPHIGHO2_02_FULL_43_16b]OGY32489.1 MAG: hypothetical protein A3A61_00865 [Candidatus Woykebacteria bacterium RIFCSPLOWO2_01_FULL_43_14]
MVYTLKFSKNAAKQISKLDNLVKSKVKEALESKLIMDPVNHSTGLTGFEIKEARRFRVGTYRVIFVIADDAIEILRVGHRRDIYK